MKVPFTVATGAQERRTLAVTPLAGHSLAETLAAYGYPLNTRCGHRGLCRGCEVEIRDGHLVLAEGRRAGIGSLIRACQARLVEPTEIFIPARSRMEHRPQVGDTFRIEISYAHQPLYSQEQGDTAFAVDIGTTTVVVLLVDLTTGAILSRSGGFNRQIRFGDNVLTRIEAASTRPGVLAEMRQAVVQETLTPLLRQACERAGRSTSRLAGGTVAGNTTMLHLLLGEDPAPLGVVPFSPRFLAQREVTASVIGLQVDGLRPNTPLRLLPGIAAYIGADIVAGICATGMAYDEKPSLLVDIGTNGEIVLQREGQLVACATAAGPAFEGSGLSCGSRAREGAISEVGLAGDPWQVEVKVIGEVPVASATGICGSAYINFLAAGRRCGLLGPMGRFEAAEWERLPRELRIEAEGQRGLRLSPRQQISEVDVALLLQAKAAIGAGIDTLLDVAGVPASALGRVYLAGGFGMHLEVRDAIAIGLLPGIRSEQVQVVGNTSLAGAMIALMDRNSLQEMEEYRRQTRVLELNLQRDFEERFIDHLLLP